MPETQLLECAGDTSSRLRAVLAHAPFHTAVLVGADLEMESADGALRTALGEGVELGVPARPALERALGDEWLRAIDAARTGSAGHRGTRTLGTHLWDLWVEPLGDGAVALYGREIVTDRRQRELLHALRNPIYGIRAAVKILMRRELSEETRGILEHIDTAADQAEMHVRSLEQAR